MKPFFVKLFANYPQNTNALKSATLTFTATRKSGRFLVDATMQKSGLTTLGIEKQCIGKQSTEALADIVFRQDYPDLFLMALPC